ncbi:(d)CMP kinase [bacterium]|nr:(d)CMP kinase [bacterium]
MIIAIDGSTASGKGTLAKRIAAAYGLPHLDTGLLYRAVGLAMLESGEDPENQAAAAAVAARLEFRDLDRRELRSAQAGAAASVVAAHPEVRRALIDRQRSFARQPGGAVLDGRDIGTVIAPDADIKFWIDASVEVRANRRRRELLARGEEVSSARMIEDLIARDERDRSRADAPARAAPDAVRLDTSDLDPEQVFQAARLAVETKLFLMHAGTPDPRGAS